MAFPACAVLKGQFLVGNLRPGSYPSWVAVLQITSLVFVIPLLLAGYSGSSRDLRMFVYLFLYNVMFIDFAACEAMHSLV